MTGRAFLTAVRGSSPGFRVGAVVVAAWIVCAFVGGVLAPHDPYHTEISAQLLAPSATHWFGTDNLGRDVLSRVLAGSRDILVMSTAAAVLGTLVGVALGMLMGYLRGWVDEVLSRIAEAVISIPTVILALMVLAAIGANNASVVLVVAFAQSWAVARTVRSAVLRIRRLDYVNAAVLRGERRTYILAREIFPNIAPVIVVEFTVRLGYAIFTVASLSFLGFGVQPPSPDWGRQIADSYGLLTAGYWWPTLFPTLAIVSLVVGFYLVTTELTALTGDRALPRPAGAEPTDPEA